MVTGRGRPEGGGNAVFDVLAWLDAAAMCYELFRGQLAARY